MSFRVHENNGNWSVGQDGDGITLDGALISYEEYKELKSRPHKVKERFERRGGKIVAKDKSKDVK